MAQTAVIEVIARGILWWTAHKPFSKETRERRQQIRKARRSARKAGVPASVLLVETEVTDMQTIVGMLKSKTMWFGLLQAFAGAAAMFLDANVVPLVDGDQSALLVTGVLTWVLRALTNSSLADKAAAK